MILDIPVTLRNRVVIQVHAADRIRDPTSRSPNPLEVEEQELAVSQSRHDLILARHAALSARLAVLSATLTSWRRRAGLH